MPSILSRHDSLYGRRHRHRTFRPLPLPSNDLDESRKEWLTWQLFSSVDNEQQQLATILQGDTFVPAPFSFAATSTTSLEAFSRSVPSSLPSSIPSSLRSSPKGVIYRKRSTAIIDDRDDVLWGQFIDITEAENEIIRHSKILSSPRPRIFTY